VTTLIRNTYGYQNGDVTDELELIEYCHSTAPGGQDVVQPLRPRPELRPVAAAPDKTGTTAIDEDTRLSLYAWGSSLSAMLVRVRDRFDGDLDQYLIHLVFVLAELAEAKAPARVRPIGTQVRPSAPRGLNALSIAEITRIPRETTRRKLKALVRSGRVHRDSDGLYRLGGGLGLEDFLADPLFRRAAALDARR
jgi:hypothetical protein